MKLPLTPAAIFYGIMTSAAVAAPGSPTSAIPLAPQPHSPDIDLLRPPSTFFNLPTCRSYFTTPPEPANDHAMDAQAYPLLSVAAREEGTTILQFIVRESGTVDHISVAQSSGFPRLDEAAVEGAAKWRYTPAMRGGGPMACRWNAAVRWTLGAGPDDYLRHGISVLQPVKADYPEGALERGESGIVFVELMVAPDGQIEEVWIARHSNYGDIDEASMRIVQERTHPKPASVDGKPVMTFLPVAVIWPLSPTEQKPK